MSLEENAVIPIVFCLFAEDVGLLPQSLFSRIDERSNRDPQRFAKLIAQLFDAMMLGGDFGLGHDVYRLCVEPHTSSVRSAMFIAHGMMNTISSVRSGICYIPLLTELV